MSLHQNSPTGPRVPAPVLNAPAVQNLGQTPITAFTYGSEAWNEMFGPAGIGLPAPTRQSAMASTAIYACSSLISGAIMASPVNIYNVDIATGERDRSFTDDLNWMLNEEFSPRWPASAGWEFLVCSILFEGDAFAKIKRDRMARAIGLEPWHPLLVRNGLTPDGARMVYRFAPEMFNGVVMGKVEVLDQDDVLHIPGFGFDGLRGLTPLRHSLRQAGAIALATQEYAGNFFANSARPDYALKTDLQLSPEKKKEIQEAIDERHRTQANSHRPMLLDGGLDIKTWSISASDMQLLTTRQFQIEEIARAYGVPPILIGHTGTASAWGTGIGQLGSFFVRYALRHHLHKAKVEMNRKLFRTAARCAEFDTSDIERADLQTLMNALRVGVGRAGEQKIMSLNEARAVLRLKRAPTKDDGDSLGVNAGLAKPAPLPSDSQEETPAS